MEAFGRTLAGTSTKVLISSMNAASQAVAANFGAAPGYSTGNAAGDTAYPFRLHTDTGGRIRLRANNATGATAYLDTDGWVFRR